MLDSLTTIDIVICIGYLVAVFAMGLWFARGQHDNEDYFLGGRKMHWLPIGLSIFAGTFSANSFVGLPRQAAYADYHLLLGIFFIPVVVTPIIWFVFVPLYHRLQLTSAYEYLERRFHRGIRLIASLLFAFYAIGWMGTMLLAVGVILQVVLQLEDQQMKWALIGVGLFATFYTTIGGVKAVVWTDAMQAFALGGGMLLVLFLGAAAIDGGWQTIWDVGLANEKFQMFNVDVNLNYLVQGGKAVYDENNIFHSDNFFGACAFGFFIYLSGQAASFTAVQRYVSMPDVASARRSLIVNGVMVSLVCTLFFLVGTMLYVFYQQTDNAFFVQLGETGKADQLLPHFVLTNLTFQGLTGLLLAGLFAAVMSSIDSGINSLTALVVCDWLPRKDMKLSHSQLLCAVFGVAAVCMSLVLSAWRDQGIFPLLMKISGMFLGLILGLFLLGVFSRRANTAGAIVGFCGGLVGLALTYYFNVAHWWFGAFTCIPTFVVGMIASYAFPQPPEEKLRGLVFGSTEKPVEQKTAL